MEFGLERAQDAMAAGDVEGVQEIIRQSRLAPQDNGQGASLDASTDLSRLNSLPDNGIPMGLPELDACWQGGYRPGELGMVVAPTGVGKSMLLAMFAGHAFWAGKSVMYMTYELTADQIASRIATAILGKGTQRMAGTWAEEC